MTHLSYPQRSEMKFLLIARMKMNVKERLNLFDRFFAAGILRGMDMTGQIYGLLQPFHLVIMI